MQIEDPLIQAISPAAQATLGRIATAHPWLAGACVVACVVGGMLGLVSGAIRPETLNSPRKRAGARIALRYGLAAKGSLADFKTLITGIEEQATAPAPDPLTVAAGSLPPTPTAAAPVAPLPPPPVQLPTAVAPPRPPAARPLPRIDPATVPPPASHARPASSRPATLRRLPSDPGRRATPAHLTDTLQARPRRHTPMPGSVPAPDSDAQVTPPEVPRPHSQRGDSTKGRGP